MARPTFGFATTAEEVASAFEGKIRGKNVLITGTSLNGIGFDTARAIAKYANLVIITGHNPDRLKAAEQALKTQLPSANVRPLLVDLSSLASARRAAAEVNASPEPLHVIIHNAAATIGPFKLTPDNLESQVATGHVVPFLLTKLLAPKLLATHTPTYTPRVIFVSSAGHNLYHAGVNFDTLGNPDREGYVPLEAYGQAKSANILAAIELSKRAGGRINAFSLHPGFIYTNIIQHPDSLAHMNTLGALDPEGRPRESVQWKTAAQGAATTLVAAFDPSLNEKAGSYLNDCVVANDLIDPPSSDPANAARLWSLTEVIIGEKFTF
ncbi:hypothetical protein FB45DRAFT_898445 [Roridomyces roridus]|uniref:Short-chain dehydrogenase n=1 Tax=Roridomyces roridus TaxID=1738132 RepID=A0AAD7CC27_9AGAR|nr:hypothetical protein FB45DRAFT_898445 [Roridomyces roridus]